MYTILTTGPGHASGNVGDYLITASAIELLKRETGVEEFQVFFRSEDLTSRIDAVNASKAVIMPGFGIREPLYPQTYGLVEDLSKLTVPLIPLGAGWKSFPGDAEDAEFLTYQPETVEFLQMLADQAGVFTTRDLYTSRVMERHKVSPVALVGDCAWYKPAFLGTPFRRVNTPRRIVFTTPHYAHYHEQAKRLGSLLRESFPDAELICAFHSRLGPWDRKLWNHLKTLGYQVRYMSHVVENLDFYSSCDLHVGYRLHGHVAFLRQRIPSVLVNEDGRSTAASATLGMGGFNASKRRLSPEAAARFRRFDRSRMGRLVRAVATRTPTRLGDAPQYADHVVSPADEQIPVKVIEYVLTQLETGFEAYDAIAALIDKTYEESMRPFLRSLPR